MKTRSVASCASSKPEMPPLNLCSMNTLSSAHTEYAKAAE